MTSIGWQCPYCKHANPLNALHCGGCGEHVPPEVALVEIPTYTTKPPQIATKTAKRGGKSKTSAKGKQSSKKIEFGGMVFDSKVEYDRFLFLADCQRKGIIHGLQAHPSFELVPRVQLPEPFRPSKTQGAITYTPDFAYRVGHVWVYEDTKGAYGNSKSNRKANRVGKPIVTAEARLRHKLFIHYLSQIGTPFYFQLVTEATQAIQVFKVQAAKAKKVSKAA